MLILLPLLAAITVVVSCSGSSTKPLEIQFGVAGEAGEGSAIARNLQFYVHEVELLDEQGQPQPFRFTAAAPWQSEQVALIDLAGDAATQRNATIRGTVASGAESYSGIRYTVGVPFEINHSNMLASTPPLDRGELFWAWQTGHKFLRVDLAADDHEWSFHLGSTGCSSASALRPPAAPCAQPNRMRVELKGDPLRSIVRFRLDPLVAAMRAANYSICTGDYAQNPACRDVYASTGLNVQSGTCAEARCDQRLWSLD